jgi:hypothetical protein
MFHYYDNYSTSLPSMLPVCSPALCVLPLYASLVCFLLREREEREREEREREEGERGGRVCVREFENK